MDPLLTEKQTLRRIRAQDRPRRVGAELGPVQRRESRQGGGRGGDEKVRVCVLLSEGVSEQECTGESFVGREGRSCRA